MRMTSDALRALLAANKRASTSADVFREVHLAHIRHYGWAEWPLCAKGLNRSRGRALPPSARYGERLRGASCLKMRSCNPHSRQEPPHDRPGHQPVTPAHDRRYGDPQVGAEDPT